MNDVTREILKKIQDKKTLDIISKEMNIREPTLKARVDSLIHQGFLGEITYGSGCKMCPMNCSSNSCSTDIKMFTLTEKGKELVENS
jgi:predicted transcriptional regulator